MIIPMKEVEIRLANAETNLKGQFFQFQSDPTVEIQYSEQNISRFDNCTDCLHHKQQMACFYYFFVTVCNKVSLFEYSPLNRY